MGSRGGRRIRVNCYQYISTGEIVVGADMLDKELTNNRSDGVVVWTAIYRGKKKRPENAVEDFVNFCLDRELIKMGSANYGFTYWLTDKNLTKSKRLSSQD
jgi:hypothetical protein